MEGTSSFAPADRGWWAGVGLAAAVSAAGVFSAEWLGETVLGFDRSPVSAIMMAIVAGMALANAFTLPAHLAGGLRFCTTTVLRVGIMLLGMRLSLLAAGRFTLVALPFVIAAIAAALVVITLLGRRLGLSRPLSGLIAVGTSICGCTAIVATAPLIKADETETSYAIACITVFGLAVMFLYPFIGQAFFDDQDALAGLWLGTSIHETAQVAGAALMYRTQYDAPLALDVATVTKLVRNLCMIVVIPLVGLLWASERAGDAKSGSVAWWRLVPWFIAGFALMSAFRTAGDAGERPFGVLAAGHWNAFVEAAQRAAEYCLLVAMAGVGLTSRFAGMRRIGPRPFALGLFAAALVGGLSLLLIALFGQRLCELAKVC